METFKQDLLHGLRVFARAPGWTAVIVISLALGIGANTAVFSVAKAILLNPLPFKDAEKLAILWEDASFIGFPKNTPAPANYLDWKERSKSFSQMAAVANGSYTLTGTGEALRLAAFEVTHDFFPLLGVSPEPDRSRFAPSLH